MNPACPCNVVCRGLSTKMVLVEERMTQMTDYPDGYEYGSPDVPRSPVTLDELNNLLITVGWTSEDQAFLRLAGEVLQDQAEPLVDLWRKQIIGSIPHLARHSRTPEGDPIPAYLAQSSLRFQQWVRDTCFRPYDQTWLDYQHEIALRHMTPKKNQVDHVRSTSFVPFRDILAFVPVMNETIKPFLAAKGHPPADVDAMHRAWVKSMQLQMALWAKPYSEPTDGQSQW